MGIIKCKMCGGDLNLTEVTDTAKCEFCGSIQTIPDLDDEKKLIQFERAERLRRQCEFDKAAGIYESIVADFRQEAEAYWGLVLCKYGIEYVDDPATGKKIPTCHRSSFDSIMEDSDFEQALENATVMARRVYREEAKVIEEIRKGIIAVSVNEEPYDIFICYKETDENGDRTLDSVLAQDVYDALTEKGYRVFFSRISLEEKLGVEYEPYIFAALNSAKIMLAFGTDYEHFNAVWVKNEWSRFLKQMVKDKEKHLIPCFKGIDAYDMPKEFARLQAQDLGKVGAIQDLLRGIEKIISMRKEEKSANEKIVIQQTAFQSNPTVDSYLERAFLFLEDGDWTSADEYCEKVLDIDPKNAQAYVYKLMADLSVKYQEDLKNQPKPFKANGNYLKAIRFADDKLRAVLVGYIEHITTRNENIRLQGVYEHAISIISAQQTENAYKEAESIFRSISHYRDATALANRCAKEAEISRKEAVFARGKEKMAIGTRPAYMEAIAIFSEIPGWKDVDEHIAVCQQRIDELDAKTKETLLERERQAEIARKEAVIRAKRNKEIAIVAISVVCTIIAIVLILNTVIIPWVRADKLKHAKAGDYVFFGSYEQDNNTSNGKEDIEWLVLEVKDGKALVISKYALDCMQYNSSYTNVTWETCTLRKWLNIEFINSAFSDDERKMISLATVSADRNPGYSTNPGKETEDRVFLLSIAEISVFFDSDSARQCSPTNYAIANGVHIISSMDSCHWWLRSSGKDQKLAAVVASDGFISEFGSNVNNGNNAVRPALWIDLDA